MTLLSDTLAMENGLEVTLSLPQIRDLARLAQPFATYEDFALTGNLPVMPARLGPEQRALFAYDPKLPITDRDRHLTFMEEAIRFGNRPEHDFDFRAVARSLTQGAPRYAPIIADWLQLDRFIFGDPVERIAYRLLQDTPGPDYAWSPYMHRDARTAIHKPLDALSELLPKDRGVMRIWAARPDAPMRIICDRIGLSAAGRELLRRMDAGRPKGFNAPEHTAFIEQFIPDLKDNGWYRKPRSGEVSLHGGETTLHGSTQTETFTPSLALRLAIVPAPWSPR